MFPDRRRETRRRFVERPSPRRSVLRQSPYPRRASSGRLPACCEMNAAQLLRAARRPLEVLATEIACHAQIVSTRTDRNRFDDRAALVRGLLAAARKN